MLILITEYLVLNLYYDLSGGSVMSATMVNFNTVLAEGYKEMSELNLEISRDYIDLECEACNCNEDFIYRQASKAGE